MTSYLSVYYSNNVSECVDGLISGKKRSNVRISTLQDELEVNGYMKHVNYGK